MAAVKPGLSSSRINISKPKSSENEKGRYTNDNADVWIISMAPN